MNHPMLCPIWGCRRATLLDVALTRFPKNQVDKWSRRADTAAGAYTATGVLTIMRKCVSTVLLLFFLGFF